MTTKFTIISQIITLLHVSRVSCPREIYLLNAIGLTPGGSSTVHIYTQNDTINLGRVQAVSRRFELYPGICLTTEEKA